MKSIRINDNSKGGLCCSASIDLSVGCKNRCVGCYAAKASRIGKSFFIDDPVHKGYDDTKFRRDCKKYARKGIQFIRLGKFSDAGDSAVSRTLLKVLQTTASEGLQVVFVTKSLAFSEPVSNALISGNHILHFSLGMDSQAQPNRRRIATWERYKKEGVNVKLRAVEDVTKPILKFYSKLSPEDVILTPMRYSSKSDAEHYGVDLSNYEFVSGYYRPLQFDKSWFDYSLNCCGEVGKITFCCDCGVQNERTEKTPEACS